MRGLVRGALAVSVTALSILANPLTAGVARAEGTDSAPTVDDGSDPKPRHHHHHDDAKDGKTARTSATDPSATTPAPVAADVPAPAPSAVNPVTTAPIAAAIVPVTPPAQAAQTTPAPIASAPSTATPLSLVPSKSLELATEAPTSNLGWKLGAIGLLAAGGFWAYSRKKTAKLVASAPIPEMRILRRTSVGVRSELLLIDLEGQRILLGVTPSNIQSLLIVPDSAMSEPVPVEEPVAPVASVARAPRERETVRESGSALRTMPSMSMLMNQIERERTEGSVAQRLPRGERTEGSVAQRAPRNEGSVAQRLPRTEGSVSQRLPRDEGSASFPKRRASIPDFNLNTEEALEGQAEGLLALRRGR